jgi:transposase
MKKRAKLSQKQVEEIQSLIDDKESTPRDIRAAQAILMIDQAQDAKLILSITRMSRSQAFNLRKKYLEEGIEAIRDKRKGKPKELLTRKQRDEIVKVIREETPRKYGYNNDFWTPTILGDLIKIVYNVQYKSKRPYYLLFKQAKFTYHIPGQVYRNRSEEEVKKWKEEIKPILDEAFSDPNIEIIAEDEMILTTQTTFQKVWLPVNQFPKIEVSNKRERRNIYGFIDIKTGFVHAFKTLKQNMFVTCDILKKLRQLYPKKKILLLWDNAGWHKGSMVKKFIEQDGRIHVIPFPRYAPEVNPQEHVWKKGRSAVTHNKFIEDIDKATDELVQYFNNSICEYSLEGFGPIS